VRSRGLRFLACCGALPPFGAASIHACAPVVIRSTLLVIRHTKGSFAITMASLRSRGVVFFGRKPRRESASRISCSVALVERSDVRLSSRESRMQFGGPTKLHRKSGVRSIPIAKLPEGLTRLAVGSMLVPVEAFATKANGIDLSPPRLPLLQLLLLLHAAGVFLDRIASFESCHTKHSSTRSRLRRGFPRAWNQAWKRRGRPSANQVATRNKT
jgi:hypothetical protein